MAFRRKIYQKMLEWKAHYSQSYALLIEGARRIGKSTIVEEFAKNEYESYILINFAESSPQTNALFDDLSNLNYIFLQLQLQYQKTLIERKSAIIFDEVQLCPKARQAIKTLVKDGRYDYIETGSLISIKKNTRDIVIPSEEKRLPMYPMDYEEFRWALGDSSTIPLLKAALESLSPLGDGTNRKLMRDFRLYMLVGGMPQAVSAYIEKNDFKFVDEVKREIIKLYENDFFNIDQTGFLSQLFDSIPAELRKNRSRYVASSVIGRKSANSLREMISQLKDSKTVLVSYHVNDPNPGMSSEKDLDRFKLFVCDTGLFTTLCFKDNDFTDNTIYSRLLSDKLGANLGYVYENAVAQMLSASGHELFYHTIANEESHHNYEIDFLLSQKNKISPVEVKSSSYNRHASLDVFSEKYSGQIQNRYLIYTKDLRRTGNLIHLPVYMTELI